MEVLPFGTPVTVSTGMLLFLATLCFNFSCCIGPFISTTISALQEITGEVCQETSEALLDLVG